MSSSDAHKFIQKVNIVKIDASGNVIEGTNIPLGDYQQSQISYTGNDTDYINLFGDTVSSSGAWTFAGETDFSKSFYPYSSNVLMRHTLNPAQVDADVTCGIIGQKDGIWADITLAGAPINLLYHKIFRREDFKLDGLTGFGWLGLGSKQDINLIPIGHNVDIDIAVLDEMSRNTSAVEMNLQIYGFLV